MRLHEVERALTDRALTKEVSFEATELAFTHARTTEHNAFRVPLAKRAIVRALGEAREMQV